MQSVNPKSYVRMSKTFLQSRSHRFHHRFSPCYIFCHRNFTVCITVFLFCHRAKPGDRMATEAVSWRGHHTNNSVYIIKNMRMRDMIKTEDNEKTDGAQQCDSEHFQALLLDYVLCHL